MYQAIPMSRIYLQGCKFSSVVCFVACGLVGWERVSVPVLLLYKLQVLCVVYVACFVGVVLCRILSRKVIYYLSLL